jgi:hypothetical protein
MCQIMCEGCRGELPARGTRYLLTIRTATGGAEVAFCTADCRARWTPRQARPAAAGSRLPVSKAA